MLELSLKIRLPHIPWRKIKEAVTGKKYSVSVAVVSDKETRRIRRILRLREDTAKKFPKSHTLNVLSFPFGKNEGEVVLNVDAIKKEAKKLKQPFKERLLYLYIHGLLHLKGYDHEKKKSAEKMGKEEKRFLNRFIR